MKMIPVKPIKLNEMFFSTAPTGISVVLFGCLVFSFAAPTMAQEAHFSTPEPAELVSLYEASAAREPAPLLVTDEQQAAPSNTSSNASGNLPDEPKPANAHTKKECRFMPCPWPNMDWYKSFVNGPQVKPLTPKEKGWLALRNFVDPFNAVTILGEAAISVGADSHSAYGPGMPGFGRYVGVSYTEDLTGEFFNTFLIPSIMHQDPHYHRMPTASYQRRIFHTVAQVVWTQGDNEKGMLNYANLVGYAIDDQIANLYVPGRQTNGSATTQRYFIGLATAPISNLISEFLPDIASHIHVQVVVVQRIVNQVALKNNSD
ncbi:hypothetical protein [Acidicapsa ligni]|uniref:hypothetical protein n=1 Tax=Acidicapsa ligni TaxID=542300 RepID=UPI0021E0AAC2|nr:hypothetical protein [Acidicapsa ligni]